METQFQRNPSPQTAGWFIDLEAMGRLDLDPEYQRRSVWNQSFREFFIDSLIRNFPTQSIFLELEIDPDRPTQYKVLDGKQRLTSLLMFVKDEFTAPDSLADLNIDGQYYSQLPRDIRMRILGYLFTVETVSNASNSDLNEAFDRLNRNVARLNKQELRHARFNGRFINKMEGLADSDFWDVIGLVTAARRRRMLDVEYVSEFYIACIHGVQDGKEYIDNYYVMYDDEIPYEKSYDEKWNRAIDFIYEMNSEIPINSTRFKNIADFYSLWIAALEVSEGDSGPAPAEAMTRLIRFEEELNNGNFERYLLAARQGSNKESNRTYRANVLSQVIRGEA